MQKLYYSISEISKLVDEEQHILRYWEKEFELLKPKKNRGGNRIYSGKDLLVIQTIKKLLRDEKLSLKGAKEHLESALLSGQKASKTTALKPKTVAKKASSKKAEESKSYSDMSKDELLTIKSLLIDIRNHLSIS